MRPFGTSEPLAQRRQQPLTLLGQGRTVAQVAEHFGITERSVRRWRQEAQHPKRKQAGRGPGHPRHLSRTQLHQLVRALRRGAYAYGYAEDYWTLDRIARFIWDQFSVHYTPSGVWHLMHPLGWSSQKAQRRPLQRDDAAITAWKLQDWPRIKKWHELGATLVFLDESGFSLVSLLKRTWSPRGETPVIQTSIEHNIRVTLIGALCLSPAQRRIQLCVHSDRHSINGERVIQFLRHLLAVRSGPLVLLWDKHPMHRRRQVQEFLAEHRRLHAYAFPTAAPELNPVEFVWTQVSEFTASSAPRNAAELQANVRAGVARTRRSPHRLWACVHASALPWKCKKHGHCLVKAQ